MIGFIARIMLLGAVIGTGAAYIKSDDDNAFIVFSIYNAALLVVTALDNDQ